MFFRPLHREDLEADSFELVSENGSVKFNLDSNWSKAQAAIIGFQDKNTINEYFRMIVEKCGNIPIAMEFDNLKDECRYLLQKIREQVHRSQIVKAIGEYVLTRQEDGISSENIQKGILILVSPLLILINFHSLNGN